MEEELNENELEERLYAMIHYVDETQTDVNVNTNKDDLTRIVETTQGSNVRRYWQTEQNTVYQKTNTQKDVLSLDKTPPNKPQTKQRTIDNADKPSNLSNFKSSTPQNITKNIQAINKEVNSPVVLLESSDEDEVIAIELPPKPTITIDSSEDESVHPQKGVHKILQLKENTSLNNREECTSPVPSIVSSVSDDFIRGDCIALNISSRKPDSHSFDFSLHGTDLIEQTPSRKKKKKRSKDKTVANALPDQSSPNKMNEYFATPKSKAKNKKPQNKSYAVSTIGILSADIYDSDSNQSVIDSDKNQEGYSVVEQNIPRKIIYKTDSKFPEKQNIIQKSNLCQDSSDSNSSIEISQKENTNINEKTNETVVTVVDLTDENVKSDSTIDENIIIGNVSGFTEYKIEPARDSVTSMPKFGSTKVPAILFEDLDFDNLKGTVTKRRKYSLATLRAEMEKFYNESWGGEDFNHREIQKSMSRDKSLWMIDPKDRMPTPSKRKSSCNYCNRTGHRDDMCRQKPPICYMCGSYGHFEPRCPRKICVNCGSPNYMYSSMCRNCASWGRITCGLCGQLGHPDTHCADKWRRYHNTIDENTPLEENWQVKKHYQMFCSGCARRGHLVHNCHLSLPFSGLPINSPYVAMYHPIYPPTSTVTPTEDDRNPRNKQRKNFNQDSTVSSAMAINRPINNKRQSKSPTAHEDHFNKKRNSSTSFINREPHVSKNIISGVRERKLSQNKETFEPTGDVQNDSHKYVSTEANKILDKSNSAPNFIPIGSTNHDRKGQVIQDNEVSDTSDIITSSRIYVTEDIIVKLKSKEGEEWLKQMTKKYNVALECTDIKSFINIKGKIGDQESFQLELRDWIKNETKIQHLRQNIEDKDCGNTDQTEINIPKNRYYVLRKLNNALNSLNRDIGDPNDIYKELTYLQNHHEQLLKQKVISSQQMINSRTIINETLKKLNMILLGQAGLAEGSLHVSELQSILQKLNKCTEKNISLMMRKQIGRHYHSIFTPMPREDYVDLLKKYHVSKKSLAIVKKNKKTSKILQFQSPNVTENNINPRIFQNDDSGRTKGLQKQTLVAKTMKKLVFYHKRLLHVRPMGTVLKRTRQELVKKLHSHISSMMQCKFMPPKALKKIRKVQEQARLFLMNI